MTTETQPDLSVFPISVLKVPDPMSVEVTLPRDEELAALDASLRHNDIDCWRAFRLAFDAECLAVRPDFEVLTCLEHLRDRWRKAGVIPYAHQIQAAMHVVGPMRGRAILADEVGLGKTIEAGMVVTEYFLRGLVRRALILTPASLCRQWQYEMQDKFGLRFMPARRPEDWAVFDLVVASIDSAKRPENAAVLNGLDWDILIVDEAHKLKNEATGNYRLVSALRKKFFLLLTATPLQNNMKELYNLITLLRPGQLGSYRSFRRHFVENARMPRNVERLKRLLGEVVIRNRRAATAVAFTDRIVENIEVDLSSEERGLYRAVEDFVRADYRKIRALSPGNTLALITLQREICSSSFAAALTIAKMMAQSCEPRLSDLGRIFELARQVAENSKMNAVERILAQNDEKVVIFTEFLATQQYIMARLARSGWRSLAFDGRCSTSRKEWTKSLFKDHPGVRALVSTETGGEGINLQFCRTMINYDLPWNPMRIEQRIGRIHRLGQTRDVLIYNLFTRQTVEEHILRLLGQKINLFQTVVGGLDRIIHLLGKDSFERQVADAIFAADNPSEAGQNVDAIGDRILTSLEAKSEDSALDNRIFD